MSSTEYINDALNLDDDEEDLEFSGWYVYGSWFITGESRNYKFKKGKGNIISGYYRRSGRNKTYLVVSSYNPYSGKKLN